MANANLLEAANRAEVTALLIRAGYKVYRPEADTEGEDLVLRVPSGELIAVQMKGRVHVEQAKYGRKGIWMLFPCSPYECEKRREWFLIKHDDLFAELQTRHGHAVGFGKGKWTIRSPSRELRHFLGPWRIVV